MKKLIAGIVFCLAALLPISFTFAQGISQLQQWKSTTTPFVGITTQTYGARIYAPTSNATTSSLSAFTICLIGDSCRTTWPSGGGGSGFSTTSSDYWLTQKNTTNLTEGSNLYYTDARVGTYISGSSTVPHIGGSAYGDVLTWTGSVWATRATSTLGISTSDIFEGTKLFFTNARAIASTLTGYTSGAGTISSSDTILAAIQKLNGNIAALVTGVSSVFGRTGAVTAQSGDYTTDQVTEGTNKYYTDARARGALSATYPLQYNSGTGLFSVAYGTTTPNTWAALQTFGAISATSSTITYASSTALSVSGTAYAGTASSTNLIVSGIKSALHLAGSDGTVSAYGGSNPCTNQVALSISAAGVVGCTSVTNAMLSNSTIGATSPNSTLSIGTAASLGSTFTADLNLGTSNLWTASTTMTKVLNLANASSSLNTFSTVWIPGITSALLSNDGNGKATAYGGSSNPCTSQVPTTISALGALGGCLSVADAWITGQIGLSHGGTNASLSGASQIVAMNSGNTALTTNSGYTLTSSLLTAPNASTTNLTAGTSLQIPNSSNPSPTAAGYITQSTNAPYQLHVGNGNSGTAIFDPRPAFTITVSSTTVLTGTTTSPVFVVPFGLTVTNWLCTVQPNAATGTVAWQYANGTAYTSVTPTYLIASTTPGLNTISSNNTPTQGATSTLAFGTGFTGTATSASCSFYGTFSSI